MKKYKLKADSHCRSCVNDSFLPKEIKAYIKSGKDVRLKYCRDKIENGFDISEVFQSLETRKLYVFMADGYECYTMEEVEE